MVLLVKPKVKRKVYEVHHENLDRKAATLYRLRCYENQAQNGGDQTQPGYHNEAQPSRFQASMEPFTVHPDRAGKTRQELRMKRVRLRSGQYAVVDDRDLLIVKKYAWYLLRVKSGIRYAIGRIPGASKRMSLMHRVILGHRCGRWTDHVNGNGLDNRRANLRPCSLSQNGGNSKVSRRKGKTSCFKGVSKRRDSSRWYTHVQGVLIGRFENEEAAARAYDVKARDVWGSFARTNFSR